MMQFRVIKSAIVTMLGNAANGRFRVVGHQRQSKSSDEIAGNNRLVQVYYSDGSFPRSGRMNGPKFHDMEIQIDISASAKAQGDLSILDEPSATIQAKAAALLAVREAAEIADNSVDEVIDILYQIIMDARNSSFGLSKGEVASRWIERVQKDQILERGDLVVKTANMKITCRVSEDVPGDIGNEPEIVVFDSSVTAGDTPGAGTLTENDNT